MAMTLKGTDYVGRTYTIVFDEFFKVVSLIILWSFPPALLAIWPFLYPEPFLALGQYAVETGRLWLIDALQILILLVQAACLSGFAIQRHRALLAPVTPLRRGFMASVLPYLGYWFLTTLAFILVSFLIGFVIALIFGASTVTQIAATIVSLVVVTMLVLRAIIIFPAIALGDREVTLVSAEAATRRNGWRILWGAALTTLPTLMLGAVAIGLVSYLLAQAIPGPSPLILSALAFVYLEYLVAAFFVTYVSLLYAHFSSRAVPEPPSWSRKVPVFNY